jgi:hypothetical protein
MHTNSGRYPSLNPAYRSAFTVSWLRIDALLRWHPFLLVIRGTVLVNSLTTDEFAIRRQGIINMTCRDSSQWLNAIPAFLLR